MENSFNSNSGDLASFIDNYQEQAPVKEVEVPSLDYYKQATSNLKRPHYFSLMDLKDNRVFPGKIESIELKNAKNGFPFLKVRVICCGSISLTHTHFIDRKKCDSTESIKAEAMEYLKKFGYVEGGQCGQEVLASVSSFDGDGGSKVYVAKRLFVDEDDLDSYCIWLKNRPEKRQVVRQPVELPTL